MNRLETASFDTMLQRDQVFLQGNSLSVHNRLLQQWEAIQRPAPLMIPHTILQNLSHIMHLLIERLTVDNHLAFVVLDVRKHRSNSNPMQLASSSKETAREIVFLVSGRM